MRRKRLYYCAFVSKTNTLNWQYKIVMGKKCPTPARLSKQKYEKKETKIGRNQMDWSKLCSKQGWNFFPHTPRNCEQLANVIQNKKKRKKCENVCTKNQKKNLNVIQIGWIPLFREKKGGTKQKQNKKKNSHPDQFLLWQFAMAASCFGSAYCLHIGKNPVCVRSKKKNETRAWKKRKRM